MTKYKTSIAKIEMLREEAGAHGDHLLVATCNAALESGDPEVERSARLLIDDILEQVKMQRLYQENREVKSKGRAGRTCICRR
jgi:hypothetical protein